MSNATEVFVAAAIYFLCASLSSYTFDTNSRCGMCNCAVVVVAAAAQCQIAVQQKTTRARIHSHLIYSIRTLTSTIAVHKIWKSPDIAQTNCITDTGE